MKKLVIEDLGALPELLVSERLEQHKTQKQIAIRTHVSVNTVYMVEHGQCIPRFNTLLYWARALGYDEIVIKTIH